MGDSSAQRLQVEALKVLANIKCKFRCSQRAVDALVHGTGHLLDLFLDVLQEELVPKLFMFDGHITVQNVVKVIQTFKGQSLFEGARTSKDQEVCMNYHSSTKPVLLKKLVLEHKRVWRRGIPQEIPFKYGYIVPFLSQLEQLLQCKDVLHCVQNPMPHQDGVMRTITDSLFYRYHPVVKSHPNSNILVFGVYVDDVEPCDALKSKTGKHNLRLFYWTLFNIHPDKRSSLKAINLLAIVKKSVAKQFRNSPFLKDFIEGIKTLGNDGIVLNVDGQEILFYGILHCAQGDTPAMANLGGFKEAHFALRPCRICMVKNIDLCTHFDEETELLRNKEDHEKFLKEVLMSQRQVLESEINIYEDDEEEDVDGDLNEVGRVEDVDLDDVSRQKYTDHPKPSVNYGINGHSILSEAPGFDVTKCIALDMMHVVAEGVLAEVCRRILKDVCLPPHPTHPGRLAPNRLKMRVLNDALVNLSDFGHLNTERPSIIEPAHLKSKLRQSASQMLVLAHTLPFLIAEHCSQQKRELLVDLLKFNNLCMSFELTECDINNIGIQAKSFGEKLKSIYPDINTLKFHFFRHIAMQARLLGPPRQLACFRYEAMHTEFTSIVPVVRTKKDIALSLGKRHILKRSAEILEAKSTGTFLPSDDIRSPQIKLISDLPEKYLLLEALPHCDEKSLIIHSLKVTKSGISWTENSIIRLKNFKFGAIKSIYLVDGSVIFTFYDLETTFHPLLNAYQVNKCGTILKTVPCEELSTPYPIAKFTFVYQRETKIFLLIMSPGNSQGASV